MKLVAAALAQPQSETVSLGSGNASGRERTATSPSCCEGRSASCKGTLRRQRGDNAGNATGGTVTAVQLAARKRLSPGAGHHRRGLRVQHPTPPPSRASRAPLATTTTTRPFANDTASNARPAPSRGQPHSDRRRHSARGWRLGRIALAGIGRHGRGHSDHDLRDPGRTPHGGGKGSIVTAPATISTAKADTASTADSLARAALATAPATTTATTTPDDSGAAHRFARIALASAPTSPSGTSGPTPRPASPRALRARPRPFGDFGSDTTPHLPAPASHAPLATTTATTASGSSAAQSSSQSTVDF